MSLLGVLAVAAAAAAGIASMVKSQSNSRNAQKTNQTNIDINAATNANNLRLAREQNEWNLAQWNRENNYNLPVNQVGRYRQAGINPYMAMNQITNGNAATGLTSANLANQQSVAVQNPGSTSLLGDFFEGASNGINTWAQLNSILEQTQNTSADTQLKEEQRNALAISNRWSPILNHDRHVANEQGIRIQGYQEPYLKKLGDYMSSSWYMDSLRRGQNASVTEAEHSAELVGQKVYSEQLEQTYMNLKIDGLSKENELILPKFMASMAETAARISKLYSDVNRNNVLNRVDTMNAQTNRMNAQTNRMNAQTNYMVGQSVARLNDETRKLVGKQIITEQAKAKGLELDNERVETIWNANKDLVPEFVKVQSAELQGRMNNAVIKGSKANIIADIVIQDMRQVGAFAKDVTSAYATLKSGQDVNALVDGVSNMFGSPASSPIGQSQNGIPFN